jgi:hypothetical protein
MHIKLTNDGPTAYSIGQLQRDNPQVSFPKSISDPTLAEYDVYPLKATEQPQFDQMTQRVEEGTPALQSSEWQQVWNIIALLPEEVQQRLLALAEEVRQKRKRLLNESDWTQVADAPVNKYVWKEYRQALRDITAQESFPLNVQWPTPPLDSN